MSKPTKKERRRLKQKLKHKQSIKLRNESPYNRLAAAGCVESCKVNDSCRDQGLFTIYALMSVPNHPPTLACFLVDKWCMGLKDAWGRLNMTHDVYHDFMESTKSRADFRLVDLGPDEARRLIAAGIRQAHVMGFRLPPDYGKWVKAMGVGEDWASADISDFGKDGKYLFVGPLDHLADHLIDGDVDRFLSRLDVDYIARIPEDGGQFDGAFDEEYEGDDQEYDEDGDEDKNGDDCEGLEDSEIRSIILDNAKGVYLATLKWCSANGEEPHPYLMQTAVLMLIAAARWATRGTDGTHTDSSPLEDILSGVPPESRDEVSEAVGQLVRAVDSFPDPRTFADAVRLGHLDDEVLDGELLDNTPAGASRS